MSNDIGGDVGGDTGCRSRGARLRVGPTAFIGASSSKSPSASPPWSSFPPASGSIRDLPPLLPPFRATERPGRALDCAEKHADVRSET